MAGEPGTVAVITGAAGARLSSLNERETIALSLPAASIALTENVWAPWVSRGAVYGDEQGANDPASIRQAKVEPASFEASEKLGVGSLMRPPSFGPRLMLTTGGVVSAVKAVNAPKAGFGTRS